MKTALTRFWQSLGTRERVVLITLLALLAAAAYGWLVHSATRARTQLGASISVLREQARRLENDANELTQLRGVPPSPAVSSVALPALVRTQTESAGISRLLLRLDALGGDQVQVEFGTVPFADWLTWIAALRAQQVRLESCRIEALAVPGLVSVTATLSRTGPR